MMERKQEVTKSVSLIKMAEKVSCVIKFPKRLLTELILI